jgi:sulfate adenylyltransferase subunit 1
MKGHDVLTPLRNDAVVTAHRQKEVLRFIVCGSVDDGKSTLIGRLLHDTQQILEDHMLALQRDSRRYGTQDGALDLALLVDGLAAEREQGITIDVAYRFFATERRSFIVADTPGHVQYTANMATGASTAEVAVLLVDARQGLTRQTRRHALIVSMLGIRRVVLAINKMDLVGWSQDRYEQIMAKFCQFAAPLEFVEAIGIPLSAKNGDNVVLPGTAAQWYRGTTLLAYLEDVAPDGPAQFSAFRLPVQWVSRPSADFRGYAGLVASGRVRVGEAISIAPSGRTARVSRILVAGRDVDCAMAGQSVTIVLDSQIDVSRGAVIAAADAPPRAVDRISVRLFWAGAGSLEPGATLVAKVGTATVNAVVESIDGRVDPDSGAIGSSPSLGTNDIGDATLAFDRPVAVDSYRDNRDTGGLILIGRETASTLALGLLQPERHLS